MQKWNCQEKVQDWEKRSDTVEYYANGINPPNVESNLLRKSEKQMKFVQYVENSAGIAIYGIYVCVVLYAAE